MSLSDLISTTYISKASALPLGDMLIALSLAFALGLFIYFVYRKTFVGVMYSRTFSVSLIGLCMITAMVILAVNSNVILSLSMVGALSIVRFRTAVKDPLDTAYMFWALTMGILLGAGQFFFAALTVVGIGALIIVMNRLKFKQMNSYLLVVHYVPGLESQINAALKGVRVSQVKSKTVSRNGAEMTIELRVEKQDALVNRLLAIEGVQDATLVAYQPE